MILFFLKKRWSFIWLFGLFFLSLSYRLHGAAYSHPFWVDEFSTASQAQLYIKYGVNVLFNPYINFEYNNYTYHFLTSVFFRLLGVSEFVARLPAILLGSTIPVIVYLLAKLVFNRTAAVSAALLTTFSYFEITWSRQARGYVLLQGLILLALYLYIDICKRKRVNITRWALLVLVCFAGILTHFFFYILLIMLTIHYVLTHSDSVFMQLKKVRIYLLLSLAYLMMFKLKFFDVLQATYANNIIQSNNLWYYHSFIWREYSIITFLAVVGIIISFVKRNHTGFILTAYLTIHLLFLCFFLTPYASRYTLPIFPLLLIYSGYTLTQLISQSRVIIAMVLTLFIVLNGDKFAVKPKQFYSVNHDFREIALLDYDKVYEIIMKKGKLTERKTAVIDTWHDRLFWYVGNDYPGSYWLHWIDTPGLVNGLVRKTDYVYDEVGDKIIPRQRRLKFIGELSDLKKAVSKFPKGFIFIDDSSLPKDVIDYAEKNFKKELYLDRYPLDDNPYSIWPATLYSWGIDK